MREQDRPYFESLWGPFNKRDKIPLQDEITEKKMQEKEQKIEQTKPSTEDTKNSPTTEDLFKIANEISNSLIIDAPNLIITLGTKNSGTFDQMFELRVVGINKYHPNDINTFIHATMKYVGFEPEISTYFLNADSSIAIDILKHDPKVLVIRIRKTMPGYDD